MTKEKGSKEPSKPRSCERCGKQMPPQKRGRPRRWCSHQCRQSAYEERHGLESWKDKQPKVSDLSEVVEVVQGRSAERGASRQRVSIDDRSARTAHDCVSVVCSDQLYMAMVFDAVTDLVSDQKLANTLEGRFLAGRVARLVEAVQMVAFRVVPSRVPPGPDSSSSGR